MRKTEIIFKRNTNFMLHGYVWKPECKPVGVIQVIHGMTEYIGRYEEFAAHFTDLGYVVCGFDLESHGKSIPIHHKDSGLYIPIHHKDSGLYIHCWDDLIESKYVVNIQRFHTLCWDFHLDLLFYDHINAYIPKQRIS